MKDFILLVPVFLISMICLTTYLPVSIAAFLSHRVNRLITKGVIGSLAIYFICFAFWLRIAMCEEKRILLFGGISPVLLFIFTIIYLKMASFPKNISGFKSEANWLGILKLGLKILLYYLLISPIMIAVWSVLVLSVDCGI